MAEKGGEVGFNGVIWDLNFFWHFEKNSSEKKNPVAQTVSEIQSKEF